MTPLPEGMTLRVHQREALAALDAAWTAGSRRAWVALPPGAGKTLVGLLTVRDRIAAGAAGRAVVLGPNTAIQGQWAAQAAALGLDVGTDRSLEHQLTALTYQALAVFDADDEVDDDGVPAAPTVPEPPPVACNAQLQDLPTRSNGSEDPVTERYKREAGSAGERGLLDRLHPNGRAFVEELRAAGPLLLVLDECHHLLEVWGRLIGELLDQLPDALVLGLTATPPEALTADQAQLVDELFGTPLYRVSIPAVVKAGDLAPFVELAWLTTPTASEDQWLAEEAERFQELVTQLTDPTFGSMAFLPWLDARFVAGRSPWLTLVREQPDLCRAVLRLHHAGLIGLPSGARLQEEHRSAPTADDWVLLVDDWLTGRLTRTGLPEDEQVVEAVRRALPSVGYQWTRRGIRRGRSPVDRVLARSESKTQAVVELCVHEHLALGERLRMLVLTDHERAGATLPADLTGVLDQQAGSAHAVLAALVAAPETAGLRPLLVTGKTVAGAAATLTAFLAWLPDRELASRLGVQPLDGALAQVTGPWEARTWVGHVTAYFQDGHAQVLVGTRALLGEGWDAKRITGLADLTAVTTITSVVQTRGRALRTDPLWPDKVAVNWSLVCVSDRHPKGGNDWDRLVRKHAGYFGLDPDGQIVDGVAHLDPAFSPYVPPPVAEFGAANARAVIRAEQRDTVRTQWRVGEPYADTAVYGIRIKARGTSTGGFGLGQGPADVVLRPDAAELRGLRRHRTADRATSLLAGAGVLAVLVAAVAGAPLVLAAGALVGVGAAALRVRSQLRHGAELLHAAEEAPSVIRIASAVADGLLAAGLVRRGADAVEVVLDRDGEYRCVLHADQTEAQTFATALDEAVSPILLPRYLLPRWVRSPRPRTWWRELRAGLGRVRPDGVVWHAVPTVLGVNAERAAAYARAWDHWVGGGDPVYTGSPEGQGVLAAQQGTDPFAASTVMRRQWE
ncbi:DEAD/DEAH box helicase [Nocardioides anomalus]|uniref:DEAD/DEAH box helicase n=1 Tax=Nocardioides anomalus TaxID=2712223 RepID=A0A6G6WEM7_9ACTN|nr:DEAD/DEAH box helicase family protein [Nocardioides anomalus]QIG43692.1 DEAD/DEAH box helicase [Nocardioides anomalus]